MGGFSEIFHSERNQIIAWWLKFNDLCMHLCLPHKGLHNSEDPLILTKKCLYCVPELKVDCTA